MGKKVYFAGSNAAISETIVSQLKIQCHKQVIHGHFVLYQVIIVIVGNTIRCNHDKV